MNASPPRPSDPHSNPPTLDELRLELAARSLRRFVEQSWDIVEPAKPFVPNWHIDAICDHLEHVSNGDIQRLLINIPPGHAKSLLVSVFWPAWVWVTRPRWRGIFSSYAHELATRDSVRCRSLIDSEWYQAGFARPAGWTLSMDSNRKHDFSNTLSGRRLSTSVSGTATGQRGDAVVVDDPLNAKEAPSKLVRDEAIFWWDKVMSSRLDDMARGARVIIMQRLHEDDLSGHVMAQGGYEHLCLPSEYDPKRRSITYAQTDYNGEAGRKLWSDPRSEPGELLFPELFSADVLKQAKRDLGSDGYAGQHDQRPTPATGGMFKKAWWRFWRPEGTTPPTTLRPEGTTALAARVLPPIHNRIISLDAAFKGSDESDFVVFTVWGTNGADRFLLDMVRGKMSFTETVAAFRALCIKHPLARKKLVEDKANGSAIIDTLKSQIGGIVAVNPEGGKEARAFAVQPQVEAGNVYLPDGAAWLSEFVDEFASFPRGRHDDIVDSMTQALLELSTSPDVARAIGMGNM